MGGNGPACPVCDMSVMPGDSYCEACGHPLGSPTCASCGAAAVDADGYCERCGLRQPTGRDHAELVLPGGAAALPTRGCGGPATRTRWRCWRRAARW
jgi:hypothetical protein